VIAAAADREQASIVFTAASRMIQHDAVLSRITSITPSIKRIQHPASGSIFRAVSHEAYSKHGLSISCLLADEVHAWPTRDLWDVLTTSMGKREQPLTIAITTAGVGRTRIAWELYAYAKRVQAGEVDDATFLPVLLEPPEGFDWRDPEVWAYVNPALGVFRSLEEMQTSAKRAEHVPAQQAAFRQLYLNEWREGHAEPWLDLAIWDEGLVDPGEISPGTRCWIGVDLSATTDLTAVVAVFEGAGGRSSVMGGWQVLATAGEPLDHEDGFLAIAKFFVPQDGIRRRAERDGVPYASRGLRKAISRPQRARWSTTPTLKRTSPTWLSGFAWRPSQSIAGTRPARRPACLSRVCRWSSSARASPRCHRRSRRPSA
jgi:phage terminase large subunit-like protein